MSPFITCIKFFCNLSWVSNIFSGASFWPVHDPSGLNKSFGPGPCLLLFPGCSSYRIPWQPSVESSTNSDSISDHQRTAQLMQAFSWMPSLQRSASIPTYCCLVSSVFAPARICHCYRGQKLYCPQCCFAWGSWVWCWPPLGQCHMFKFNPGCYSTAFWLCGTSKPLLWSDHAEVKRSGKFFLLLNWMVMMIKFLPVRLRRCAQQFGHCR